MLSNTLPDYVFENILVNSCMRRAEYAKLSTVALALWLSILSQNISVDLKGSKVDYKVYYGRSTVLRFRAATRHSNNSINNNYNKK